MIAWKSWTEAILAAFAASFCCIGPPVAVGLGISIVPWEWIPAVEKWRPLFLGLAGFLLFHGYHRARGRSRCACEPQSLFRKRLVFGAVATIVVFLMAYPCFSVWIRK